MGRYVKAKLLIFLLTLCAAAPAFAQKVSVEVGAPTMVAVGEVFRIEFALNAKPDGFDAPAISGFDVLAGPTVSQGTSISIVNGDVTKTFNYTYTYVLQAKAEGKFTISAASVTVDGRTYSSQPFAIEVVAEGTGVPSGGNRQSGGQSGQQQASATLSPDDMLLGASVSRTSVYKGQPVKLTLKIYKRVPLGGISGTKLPAFNGFWSQELPQNPNRQWQRESYNDKVYDAMVIGEYLLYPQQSGTLSIEPFQLTAVAQIVTQTRSQSIFDDFFGGPQVQEVRKELRTRPIQVTVKDFPPGAPASFNGAVGDFSLDANVSSKALAANSAGTYTIKISGSGNLPLIKAPILNMPGSFEQYNIKTTESLNTISSGITGYRQFEYPFIPRAEGSYTLEPVEITYFNPETGRYVTLAAPETTLAVAPDAGGAARNNGGGIVAGLTKEDIKILGKDIRFIKIGAPALSAGGLMYIGSFEYFALLLLVLVLCVVTYVFVKRHIRQRGNVAAIKGKRANKVALSRLRAAERYKREGDRRRFLDETLRALWGYMGDRLNIPAANLTKDNVREQLTRREVPAAKTENFIDVISNCELAQYSPETTGETDAIYGAAVEAISAMESVLK